MLCQWDSVLTMIHFYNLMSSPFPKMILWNTKFISSYVSLIWFTQHVILFIYTVLSCKTRCLVYKFSLYKLLRVKRVLLLTLCRGVEVGVVPGRGIPITSGFENQWGLQVSERRSAGDPGFLLKGQHAHSLTHRLICSELQCWGSILKALGTHQKEQNWLASW